jgi:hypothetical protein
MPCSDKSSIEKSKSRGLEKGDKNAGKTIKTNKNKKSKIIKKP